MKNRVVGFLIIGIALLIGYIVYSFNKALKEIVDVTCTHGPTCPMLGSVDFHTSSSIAIMVFIIIIGLYLVFFGREEKIITKVKTIKEQITQKPITKENFQEAMKALGADERQVFERVIEAQGSVFQSDLVEKTGMSKVKVTRILDKLEGKNLIERKRRGMTNVVILKRG